MRTDRAPRLVRNERRVVGHERDSQAEAKSLFRVEAVAEQQVQWLGTVLLEPRVTSRVFAITAAVAIVVVLGLLFLGSYTRKERINGWLVPEHGLARIYAPQQGVVTKVLVKDGVEVTKGTPLLTLSTELHSGAVGATREEIVRHLTIRRNSVLVDEKLQASLLDQQAQSLKLRIETLKSEQQHLAREMELQRVRLRLSEKTVERDRMLRAKGLVTEPRLEQAEHELVNISAGVESLGRNLSALQRQELEVRAALEELPIQRQAKLAEIRRNAALLEQDLAEAESRREIVITASQDGAVSDIQVQVGGNARPDVLLLSIVPSGSLLRAQLFSPSRAIGFIRPGQTVLLRYRAFPFQKFGLYEGTVAAISGSAISPSELPRELAGLTSLYGTSEPVYRIIVNLKNQTAYAYGKAVPLHPGMQLEADVQIERRRLIEWLLDPLFSLTRGAQG